MIRGILNKERKAIDFAGMFVLFYTKSRMYTLIKAPFIQADDDHILWGIWQGKEDKRSFSEAINQKFTPLADRPLKSHSSDTELYTVEGTRIGLEMLPRTPSP